MRTAAVGRVASPSVQSWAVVGDSFATAVGVPLYGATRWDYLFTLGENTPRTPNLGYKHVMMDTGVYGSVAWFDIADGVPSGVGLSQCGWRLNGIGQSIADNTPACTAIDLYYTTDPAGATGEVFIDSDLFVSFNTAGLALSGNRLHLQGGNLQSGGEHSLTVNQASAGVLLIDGYEPWATNPPLAYVDNGGVGGYDTTELLAGQGTIDHLRVNQPRHLMTYLGANDMHASRTAAQFQTDLGTWCTLVTQICPNTQHVIIGEYYAANAALGLPGVGNAAWVSDWLPVYVAVAAAHGCTYVNAYAVIGDMSTGANPYDWGDKLHLNAAGHAAWAAALSAAL